MPRIDVTISEIRLIVGRERQILSASNYYARIGAMIVKMGAVALAWWISRSSAYAGPGFDWVEPESVVEKRGLYGSGLSLSRALTERNVPKVARYRKSFGTGPVADVFFVSSAVVVNKRFKNLVERFGRLSPSHTELTLACEPA